MDHKSKRQVDMRLQLSEEEYQILQQALIKYASFFGQYRVTYKEFILGMSQQIISWQTQGEKTTI